MIERKFLANGTDNEVITSVTDPREADERWPWNSPHRSVHLVEAGYVAPEVALVVKSLKELERIARSKDFDLKRAKSQMAFVMLALKNLTPEQLKACGVEP